MTGTKLRDLFEFSAATVQRGAAEQCKESGARPNATPGLSDFLAQVGANRLNEALDSDAFELLCEGWVKFKKVRDCADPAKHVPDETSVVPLRDVEITSTNTPVLSVTVGEVKLPELRFTLELVAKFAAVDLVIRDGRIRSLRPGACSAIVRLKYGAAKLGERSTPEWKLAGEISLGQGIVIRRGGH